jgi:hypothetical protein
LPTHKQNTINRCLFTAFITNFWETMTCWWRIWDCTVAMQMHGGYTWEGEVLRSLPK